MRKIIFTILAFNSLLTNAEVDIDKFAGCEGRDTTGKNVKVESLVRSLENCPFAKVYLKENENTYKTNLDQKIAMQLKTSLDQDLEALMLQGEFFETLGLNLTNYGQSESIKSKCQLDKMTDFSSCQGKDSKEYERKKNILLTLYGAKSNADFSQQLKNKLKAMAGKDSEKTCSLVSEGNENYDQFLLFQAGLTKKSLIELKNAIEEKKPLSTMLAQFPLLDLIFKDKETSLKFINEVQLFLSENKNTTENQIADLLKNKVKDFYANKDNADAISRTMANTCSGFQKKIHEFVCSDDINYETSDGIISKRLFDGFDMTQSNNLRNKRVNLNDKEMAFMAFGKKCEIDERDKLKNQGKNIESLIGLGGVFNDNLREESTLDEKKSGIAKLQLVAKCSNSKSQNKGDCNNLDLMTSANLQQIYNCPQSAECDDQIEKTVNYLAICERRNSKIMARKNQEELISSVESESQAAESRDTVTKKKKLDLDFFDNLLSDEFQVSLDANINGKEIEKQLAKGFDQVKIEKDVLINSPYLLVPKKDDASHELGKTFGLKPQKSYEDNSGTSAVNHSSAYSFDQSWSGIGLKKPALKINQNTTNQESTHKDFVANERTAKKVITEDEAQLREKVARLEAIAEERAKSDEEQVGKTNFGQSFTKGSVIDSLKSVRPHVNQQEKQYGFQANITAAHVFKDEADEKIMAVGSLEPSVAVNRNMASVNQASRVGVDTKNSTKSLSLQTTSNNTKTNANPNEIKDARLEYQLNFAELNQFDQERLDAIWKDKNLKLYLGIKNQGNTDIVILTLDKDKRPFIENFSKLTASTQKAILEWKLFKENKNLIRMKDLNSLFKLKS